MMFLMDENARPLPDDLKLWVNIVKYIKRGAPGGALSFFTYMELSALHLPFLLKTTSHPTDASSFVRSSIIYHV